MLLVYGGFEEFFDGVAMSTLNYIGLALFALAAILTVISGVNYIVKNRQVLKQ